MFFRFRDQDLHLDVVFARKQSGFNILKLPGFPSFPKEDKFTQFCQRAGFNVFIPHYLGSWLSDGVFTPKNCLKTVEMAVSFIKRGKATELYNYETKKWRKENIILCGSSFGGFMALKYCSLGKIKKCALFAPLIDLEKQGVVAGEEKMEHTLRFARNVFKNAFRGIEKKGWEKFFSGSLPEAKIDFSKLKRKLFFICHGTVDPTVDIKHTREFVKSLKRKNVSYFEIKNANHKIWDYLTEETLEKLRLWIIR